MVDVDSLAGAVVSILMAWIFTNGGAYGFAPLCTGGRGGFGGGGRGGYQQRDFGPPETVLGTSHTFPLPRLTTNSPPLLPTSFQKKNTEMGSFVHAVEDEMLCQSLMADKVPHFNAPIYLQNKSVIGKVDEILGPINEVFFSVKMGDGMVASSFKKGDKVYISGEKLLPIDRFLPKPKIPGGTSRFFQLSFSGCAF